MKKFIFYFNNTVSRIFDTKQSEDGSTRSFITSVYNFVGTGEKLLRIVNVNSDEEIEGLVDDGYTYHRIAEYSSIKPEEGVYFDEINSSYVASHYGFAMLRGGQLSVVPLLTVTKDKQKAYLTVYPTKFGKLPDVSEVLNILNEKQIKTVLPEEEIKAQLDKLAGAGKVAARLTVAQGREPIDGCPEYYQPLMDLEKKVGTVKSDGSMDFREIGSIIQITTGQELLKRIPEVKPADGVDVYGITIPAVTKHVVGYKCGENLMPSSYDSDIFVSAIDGVLKVSGRRVFVLRTVVINGDLDYKTGNIDFDGSVTVTGSVLPGFRIKATGDINVKESVENAILDAGGDVKIGGGIVGREGQESKDTKQDKQPEEKSSELVKVVCGGNLSCKYLLNAAVEANGNIAVEDSIINSNVFSNSDVIVTAKNGKIIGGSVTALYTISVKVAGSPSNRPTELNVGRGLAVERELDSVKKDAGAKREEITAVKNEIRIHFGEQVFKDPKGFLNGLIPAKRKKCLELLSKLNQLNAELQTFLEKSDEVAQKLVLDKEPCVIATDTVYPGVTLNIKKNIRKILQPHTNVKFFDDAEAKEIRFVPAV